ncbi:hypothetical protein IL306_011084, partial [Fusarium sp. DS 682]
MVFARDLKTGLIVFNDVDSDESPLFKEPELGDSRRAYMKLIEEENKLKRLIESTKRSNNPVRNIDTTLDKPLLYQEHDQSSDDRLGYPNAKEHPGMWVRISHLEVKTVDPDAPFLNRLAYFCRESRIRPCGNNRCLKNKEEKETLVPQCQWPRFREWAVALSSCHESFGPKERITPAYSHLIAAIGACQSLLENTEKAQLTGVLVGKANQTSTTDVFGVCEVIYWMLTTLDTKLSPVWDGRWGPNFLPADITAPAVANAIETAKELGLCPNRFWNLIGVTERKQAELPAL